LTTIDRRRRWLRWQYYNIIINIICYWVVGKIKIASEAALRHNNNIITQTEWSGAISRMQRVTPRQHIIYACAVYDIVCVCITLYYCNYYYYYYRTRFRVRVVYNIIVTITPRRHGSRTFPIKCRLIVSSTTSMVLLLYFILQYNIILLSCRSRRVFLSNRDSDIW